MRYNMKYFLSVLYKISFGNVLLVLFTLIIFFTFLIPLASWVFCFIGLDPKVTGPMGDTVGGLTSPLIGIFSVLLIYRTFKSQIKANDETQKANIAIQKSNNASADHNAYQLWLSLFQDIKIDFSNITEELITNKNSIKEIRVYKGTSALNALKIILNSYEEANENDCPSLNQLSYILHSLTDLVNVIKSYQMSDEKKEHILRLILFFYNSQIRDSLEGILNETKSMNGLKKFNSEISDIHKRMNEFYSDLFDLQDRITQDHTKSQEMD